MKYYLSISKNLDPRYQKNYIRIQDFLKDTARDPNNLKDICEFTFQFDDGLSLRKYLISQGLIDKNFLYNSLAITYYYRRFRSLLVPYSFDKQFFSKGRIIDYIATEVRENPNFMELFRIRQYLPEAYYILRNASYSTDIYGQAIEFVEKMCNGSFKTLFDLAMIIANIERSRIVRNNNMPVRTSSLSEAEEEEASYLERRRTLNKPEIDGQMSLFRC